ncbi:MAG: hypothetical protein JJU06_11455, partial [Ectothiorhodospiraceae bacterium]|nr:hypothetical protein [Ectothiorhodospiraceae bacterium]
MSSAVQEKLEQVTSTRQLPGWWVVLPGICSLILTLLTLDYLFNTKLLGGYTMLETQFYYAVVAIMMPLVFIMWPAWSGAPRDRI